MSRLLRWLGQFGPRELPRSRWSQALLPGLHLKRWLLLLLLSVTLAGLGLAFLLQDLYVATRLPRFFYGLALTTLTDWMRGLALLALGLLLGALAVWRLNRVLLLTLFPGQSPPRNMEMVDLVLQRQARRQGPRIVAIGGGTGMPALLRGLRHYTDNITAIVTVADDGGSSGRLRRQPGMLPPGDFRNNIAALSTAEDLMTRLFQYRFPDSVTAEDDGAGGLAGHSFGNLFITTMAAVTGSFESGIAESSRVLSVRGRVLPSTLEQVVLCAEISRPTSDGGEEWLVVEGESKIPQAGGQIVRVFLKPEHPRAYPLTIQAILQADLIVAGPGSFFTSVMPNLLVPDIQAAICATAAPRIYICNVATQPGETDGYTVDDHMRQLRRHVGNAFDTVLANDRFDVGLATSSQFVSEWVPAPQHGQPHPYRLFTGDLVDVERPWRHDPHRLAARIMSVYQELRAAAGQTK